MRPDNIRNDAWCNYCGGKQLCGEENCDACFKKSFASSFQAENWSIKNKVHPRTIFKIQGANIILIVMNVIIYSKCHYVKFLERNLGVLVNTRLKKIE